MVCVTGKVVKILAEAKGHADDDRDVALAKLTSAHRLLVESHERAVSFGMKSDMLKQHDVYLFSAELAIRLEAWEVASHCLAVLRQTPPTRPPLICRYLVCESQLCTLRSKGEVGAVLVDKVHTAVAKALKAIQIALRVGGISHLVVLASKQCWNAVRVLYKVGTVGAVVSSLAEVVSALEQADYKDWRARVVWTMRLAVAEVAAGKDPKASVANAVALAEKHQMHALRLQLRRVQFSLKLENPKGGSSLLRGIGVCQGIYTRLIDEKDQEAEILGAYQELAASTLVGAGKAKDKGKKLSNPPPPAAKGGKEKAAEKVSPEEEEDREEVLAELGLLAALHPVPTFKDDPSALDNPLRDKRILLFNEYEAAVVKSREGTGAELRKEHFNTSTSIGATAAEHMLPAVAKDIAIKAAHAKRLTARVYAELTLAVLNLQRAGGLAVQKDNCNSRLTPAMQQQIAASIKMVEKTLPSALRTHNMHIIQICALLIWNIGLPLLGVANHILGKPFLVAYQALETSSSNLHRLKAQLLYELACFDVDDEFIQKAHSKLLQAMQEDYVADPDEAAFYGMVRPLDRLLIPLKERLELRVNMYHVPDHTTAKTPEEREQAIQDEVNLLLDQASDIKQPSSLFRVLERAVNLISTDEPPVLPVTEEPPRPPSTQEGAQKKGGKQSQRRTSSIPGGTAKVDNTQESRRRVIEKRAVIWNRLLRVAWSKRFAELIPIVRQAVPKLLERQWLSPPHRPLRQDQCTACLTYADTFVVELEKKGLHLGQTDFASPSGEAEHPLEQKARRSAVLAAQNGVNEYISRACAYAPALLQDGDRWAVINIAIQYTNWCSHVFERGDFLQEQESEVTVHRESDGRLGLTVDATLTVDSVIPSGPAEGVGVKQGVRIKAVDGVPVRTTAEFNKAVEQGSTAVVLSTSRPLQHTTLDLLRKLVSLLYSDSMGISGSCPLSELRLVSTLSAALARSLLQHYMKSKLPNESSSLVATTCIATFPDGDPVSPFLKEAAEVCEKTVLTLQNPMETKFLTFLLASTKRLAAPGGPKPADVPLRPDMASPQEKVLAALEVMKHTGADKSKLLRDAFDDLSKNPNVELCARLADRAMAQPPVPQLAIQICQIAKEAEAKGQLGVVDHTPTKPPDATEKPKKGDAKTKKMSVAAMSAMTEEIPPPRPTPVDYMWYSNVLLYAGQAAVGLIDTANQERATQSILRKRALEDITAAAEYALKSRPDKIEDLVAQAVRAYYVACQPFVGMVVTRLTMLPSLKRLLTHEIMRRLDLADDDDMSQVVLDLFLALIQACRDQSDYDTGLRVMKSAFSILPRTLHKPLWEADVQFRCKMGHSAIQIRDRLRGVKGYDVVTQARAWSMFARCTPCEADQMHAMKEAVTVLKDEPSHQALALSNLAMWMLSHGVPPSSCIDILLHAADKLSELVDDQPDDRSSDAKMQKTTTSRGLTTRQSFVSTQQTVVTTMTGTGTVKTAMSAKSAVPSLPHKDYNIQQLQALMTIYVTLAVVGGRKHPDYLCFLQLASVVSTKMFRLVEQALRVRGEEEIRRHGSRTSPDVAFPDTLPRWIGYTVPDELITYLATCRPSPLLLCPSSLHSVPHAFAVIQVLLQRMVDEGLLLQALPVLALERILVGISPANHITLAHATATNAILGARLHKLMSMEAVGEIYLVAKVPLYAVETEHRFELIEQLKELLANRPAMPEEAFGAASYPDADEALELCHVLLRQCRLLADAKLYGEARGIAEEALVHAEAWRDPVPIARCQYVLARCAFAEGDLATAERLVHRVITPYEGRLMLRLDPGELCDATILRIQLLLARDRVEQALAVVHSLEQRLEEEKGSKESVEVAYGVFLQQCTATFLGYYRGLVGERFTSETPPHEMIDELKNAVDRSFACVAGNRRLVVEGKLLQISLLGVGEAAGSTTAEGLRMHKTLLSQETQLIREAVQTCRAWADMATPCPFDTTTVCVVPPAHHQLARLELMLARNTLDMVNVNHALRVHHELHPVAQQNGDGPEDDRVAAFLTSKEGIRFMTATKAQQSAQQRYRKRQELREARMAELRRRWVPPPPPPRDLGEAPTGTPHNQRRVSTRKSSVRSPASHSPTPPVETPEMSLVKDAPDSDDIAAWEEQVRDEYPSDESVDSSEECEEEVAKVEEVALAVEGVKAADRVTVYDAMAFATAAKAKLAPDTASAMAADLMLCIGARQAIETAINSQHTKLATRRAVNPEDMAESCVDKYWQEPIEVPVVDVEEDKAPAKPQGKKAKPTPEVATEPPPPPSQPLRTLLAGHVEAVDRGKRCLEFFMATDRWGEAASAAMQMGRLAVVAGDIPMAARCVCLAQCLEASRYMATLLRMASPHNTREVVLLNLLLSTLDTTPGSSTTPRHAALQQVFYDSSPLGSTLRPCPPGVPPLPSDKSTYMVLHLTAKHIYVVVTQGPACYVRRAPFDRSQLEALLDSIASYEGERVSSLNGDMEGLSNIAETMSTSYDQKVVEPMVALLGPALSPFAKALAAPRTVVLCAPAVLQALPLEALPVFDRCKAVVRDLSVFHHKARCDAVAASEKGKVDGVRYVLDLHNETNGSIGSVLAGKTKPSWEGVCGSPLGEGSPMPANPPSTSQLLTVMTIPPPAPLPCIICVPERLGNTVQIPDLVGSNLSHLRFVLLLDRGTNAVSYKRATEQDTKKAERAKVIERSVHVAMLLLAKGVGGLVCNQYSASIAANNEILRMYLSGFDKPTFSIADTLQEMRNAGLPGAIHPTPSEIKKGAAAKGAPQEALKDLTPADRYNPVVWGVV